MLFSLADFTGTTLSSRVSPLAAALVCQGLFEYVTAGVDAASATLFRAVRLFQGLAAIVARARVCMYRRDGAAAAIADVAAVRQAWFGDDDGDRGVAAEAALLQRLTSASSLLHGRLGGDEAAEGAGAPTLSLDEVFPVDSSAAVGLLLDSVLVTTEWIMGWWILVLKMRSMVAAVPPKVTRCVLEYCLSTFPGNATFLSLYATSELQAQVRTHPRVQSVH